MSKKINLLTLVISSSTYPAVRNMKMQKKLFNKFENKNTKFIWYRGGSKTELKGKKFVKKDKDLLIDINDDTLNMGKKTILAFEWALQNSNFDYIIRPTPSSYVYYPNLEKYINENYEHEKIVYGGTIQETNDKDGSRIEFASGSTLILNRRCVEIIVNNKHLWDHDYWDDVGLAILLNSLDINPSGGERFDVRGNPYKFNIDLNFYQYRCRSDNHYGYPRWIESLALKAVDKLLTKGEWSKLEKKFYSTLMEFLKIIYIYQFGWKIFELIKKVLKILIPKKLYLNLKNYLQPHINSFKHKRFKT